MDNHSINKRLENWNNGIVEGCIKETKNIIPTLHHSNIP
jgi:hypothetical protein